MVQVAWCGNQGQIERVFADGHRERLASMADVLPGVLTPESIRDRRSELGEVRALFSTWGMPCLDDEALACLPKLEAVFYAAGSVKNFAEPLLARQIIVHSSWAANAVPVAEFTLAQILLSTKGYWANTAACRDPARRHARDCPTGPGNFGACVALLGFGMIGRLVAELLRPFQLRVVAVDPHLPAERFAAYGVEQVDMQTAFREALVVSNHLPNIPATVGMIDATCFAALQPGATFINTGRGAQVVEADLIACLQQRPDVTALLDVTSPEPPVADSPFYTLPNCHLTSHIAGSLGDEVRRMADYALDGFAAWQAGEELPYAVTPEMLPTMA